MTSLVLAMLLAATVPGAATPDLGQPVVVTAKPAKPAADPDKVVCRSEETVGSRMRSRKCMTQRQWEAQDEQTRQYFQDVEDRGGQNIPSGNAMAPH